MDILFIMDNNQSTVGGEQESSKIIIHGIKSIYGLGVIQPGEPQTYEGNVHCFKLTDYLRIKHMVKNPIECIKYIKRMRCIINECLPGIIHTQGPISFLIVSFLKNIRLISSRIKLIHTDRALYVKYNKFIRLLFLYSLNKLDVLVTTTEFNMNCWKEALKNRTKNLEIRVIENTAGKLFETYDETKVSVQNGITIGFSGRYCDWKNWPLAENIINNLDSKLKKELKVKMAIGCLDQKSLEQTNLMFSRLSSILGCRFEGSINLNIDQMEEFYYGIDIFILTSNRNTESFGRTLVEAMSRKTLVLTTNSGGSVEVIDDPCNVCNTAEEFTSRVLEYYHNKELMENDKNRNLTRVKEKYSLSNNIEKHIRLYNDIKGTNTRCN